MAKRCLIVSFYFPPDGGGGVQRIVKWMKYLSRKEWSFTVITASEEGSLIPQDISLASETDPDTKILRIGNQQPLSQKSILKKTKILKISNYMERWLSAFFFIPDSRKNWLTQLKPILTAELKKQKYDCLLISIPPYSLALSAAEMACQTDVPVILDMRDPWSANPYKIHPTKFHRWRDRRLELETVEMIPNIISAYQNIFFYYKKHIANFTEKKCIIIPNGFDEEDFENITAQKLDPAYFHIAFSGTFYSHLNNPRPLFEAIALLKRDRPEMGKKIRFHHIGNSMITLRKTAKKYGLSEQVNEWGYLPHKAALEYLSGMDALFFILDDRYKNCENTIGGKVYEYLRLRKPILALVPEKGEAADLINYTDSGKVISPWNTQAIAETLKDWVEETPHFGFKNIEKFQRSLQADELAHFIEEIC